MTTGIFKEAVEGPVRVEGVNLVGDQQADLRVHGGPDKAVYAYDTAHYGYWREQVARTDWSAGLFGENLTTEGLMEDAVRVGDLFRVGTARLRAVQPRLPCYKLNVRFDDPKDGAALRAGGATGHLFSGGGGRGRGGGRWD